MLSRQTMLSLGESSRSAMPFPGWREKMIKTFVKQFLAITLTFLLIINAVPSEAGGQEPTATGSTGYSGQGAPLSADELQQLATPIALYPDALVAQILGAATFPD
jgi:hypothetical protein